MLRFLKFLVHDALGIFGFALVAALLPKAFAARLLGLGARLHLGHPDIDAAQAAAERCWPERSFDRVAFRRMTLAEASMAWRLVFGRRLALEIDGEWPDRPGFAAIGGHYGIGIAVLWAMREAGLRPRFLLHPPDPGQRRRRPMMYAWSRIRFRLVGKLCPDGAIVTPGARRALEQALDAGATSPVLLLDTPASPDRDAEPCWTLILGQCRLALRRGACELLERRNTRRVYFWARMNPASGRVKIEIARSEEPIRLEWPALASRVIAADPCQWQFWPFIGGALRETRRD